MEAVNAWLSHSDPATPHIAAHSRRQPPPFMRSEEAYLIVLPYITSPRGQQCPPGLAFPAHASTAPGAWGSVESVRGNEVP